VIEIRLTSPVASFSTRPGTEVDALVVAPVRHEGKTLIPMGSWVRGHVAKVRKVGLGLIYETANLQLTFTELQLPGQAPVSMQTRVLDVENSRETVNSQGRIQGIRSTGTYGYRANTLISGFAIVDPIAYIYVNAASARVLRFSEPEIWLPPGTELEVKLTAPLALTKAYDDAPPLIASPGAETVKLRSLIKSLPYRTMTENSNKPSDLTNLLFIGDPEAVQRAFSAAGWVEADKLNGISGFMTLRSIAENQGYQNAPMSTLLLDEQRPEITLSKTLNTFSKRHHTRVWVRPETWNGMRVLTASSTQDIGIALSRKKKTFIHVIDTSIDNERAKIVNDLIFTGCVEAAQLVARPWVPLDAQNSTGEDLITDGRIAVLEFNGCNRPRHSIDLQARPAIPVTGNVGERGFRQSFLMARNEIYRGNLVYQGYEGTRMGIRYLSKKEETETQPIRAIDVADNESGHSDAKTRTVAISSVRANALKAIKAEPIAPEPDDDSDALAPRFEIGLQGGWLRFGSNTLDLTKLDLEPKTPEYPLIIVGIQNRLHNGFTASTTLTLNSFKYFSNEFGYSYQRGAYRLGASFYGGLPNNIQAGYEEETAGLLSRQFEYGFVTNLRPRQKRFRPYVAVGPVFQLFNITDAPFKSSGGLFKVGLRNVGLIRAAYNFGSTPPLNGGGIFQFGFQYGGGFKYRFSRRWLIQLDYRETAGPQPDFIGRSFHVDDAQDSDPYVINVERNRPGAVLRQQRTSLGFSFAF
jgi:opacity protein-like surface antigen